MIGSRLGPYEVVAKLGEGGMGEVYRATDTKLKRQVALKIQWRRTPIGGSGSGEVLLKQPLDQFPYMVAADGTLVYIEIQPTTGLNVILNWTEASAPNGAGGVR